MRPPHELDNPSAAAHSDSTQVSRDWSFGEALTTARLRITQAEARLLLREASGASAAAVIAFPERLLDPVAATMFFDWVAQRERGEPIAYIIGWREFYGRRFTVGPGVLIPRPETELLVDAALERLSKARARVLDLGTGSGAIAVSLACEAPTAEVWAVDASDRALEIARENAATLSARVYFVRSDWYSALPGERFDLLVANPPYIADQDPHLGRGDLLCEPLAALVSGPDGLRDIRHIIQVAPAHLASGGWLLLEHGYDQSSAVRNLLLDAGFREIKSLHDLAGIERVSLGQWPE